jgi:hypothetical protein
VIPLWLAPNDALGWASRPRLALAFFAPFPPRQWLSTRAASRSSCAKRPLA